MSTKQMHAPPVPRDTYRMSFGEQLLYAVAGLATAVLLVWACTILP